MAKIAKLGNSFSADYTDDRGLDSYLLTTDEHLCALIIFNREWTQIDANCCWKTVRRSQHTAHGRVGRRVVPGSAAAAFPDHNDGQQSFSAACHIRDHLCNPRGKSGAISDD
ncbi:MAG TPA: hypothetical protein VNW30_10275 [Opitutaceae bacterium]|nr:hypothetical protein [Opitutaceae bacterium]